VRALSGSRSEALLTSVRAGLSDKVSRSVRS
jgi:hypothetical protein